LKSDEIVSNFSKEIFVFASEHDIPNFYRSGLLDKLQRKSKDNTNVQLLLHILQSCFFIEKIKLKKAKNSLSNAEELLTFILADNEQLLLFIRKNNGKKRVAHCGLITTLS